MPDAIRHLTLANGLQLTLRHAPRLKRAAAALRVHAGSHDAPARWPGLAHFLEHLFFLGTERFALADGLMRYVQGVAGQVNASTRERTTDFFFEVPPAALAGGLERLCQMLAEPDLGIERQRREREVIHAEFIAWSRNPEAQAQFALLQAVSAQHPLSAFHAGNRHTLAVHSAAFQQALAAFHQTFYQGGQMHLSLCGPQPLDALETIASQFGKLIASGAPAAQASPPALLAGPLIQPASDNGHLQLLFAHEHLPKGTDQAIELLLAYLGDSRPGSWLAALRQRGWLQDYKAQALHEFAGQLLWHLRLQLREGACKREVRELLDSWLSFIRQADAHALNEQFGQLQRSREQAASALELARQDSTGRAFGPLDQQGLSAFQALLDSLPPGTPGQWQLPPADPLLQSDLPCATAALPTGLAVTDCLPSSRQFAVVYLRWSIASPQRARLHGVLTHALRPLAERAERASVELDFSASGDHWQLRCAGLPAAVIRTLDEALPRLRTPDGDSWAAPAPNEPPLIPIRALLKQLPEALTGSQPQPLASTSGGLDQTVLDQVWQNADWQGLAVGFDSHQQAALGAVLGAQSWGRCAAQSRHKAAPTESGHGRRWVHADNAGSEHALLFFCPLPAAQQGAGRLLAQLLQGPVYQRLRVELQLGYAVFSAFRQIDGVGGLLFGVQSPHATPAQILEHLLNLLKAGITLDLPARQALASTFTESAMPNAEVAHWAWQTYLATEAIDLDGVRGSILKTGQTQLDALLLDLLNARHGWLCLATSAAPSQQWR
ncbi:coenzyme PQQ biosynthesis probable peptidase PqqF [Pseudomonas hunanensis]|uniref:Coenzyme PQQ biosynthesis probable peptidase PqqF n=1 Tax=Pseudomonas hunanensis TaxID=1247546 RepID=A0ACC6K4J8_9PSED|nr:pyrroloquinoline quinone biosynthesis protein PqqF [Pseudomonas hunanensis]MDR6713336.1 coenzyme PQQ biosynthesis probable peptidase PqqF [Pseudomonas hunanensis]